MAWVYYITFALVGFFGILMNIVGLPGNWILVLAMAGYAWLTGWDVYVGIWALGSVMVLGLAGEAAEFIAGGAGAKSAGGTKRGMVGAIVGGFLGAIFLSIIPVPIVSQIIGACAGAFIGAFVVEFAIQPHIGRSTTIGWGAAKGRLWGILIKLLFGFIMLAVALMTALPVGAPPPPALQSPATPAPPTTEPATPPAELE